MLAARHRRRPAFTLIEVMMVMAVVLILGAILVPALVGMWSNNRTKAGADIVAGRMADARGAAISQARPYRVSAKADGDVWQVRVAPDESEQPEESSADATVSPLFRSDLLPKGVVLTPKSEGTDTPSTDGWLTLAVFLPDGTCLASSEFTVSEPNVTPLVVRVRAMTGVVTVNPETTAATGGRQ